MLHQLVVTCARFNVIATYCYRTTRQAEAYRHSLSGSPTKGTISRDAEMML
ncbi:MAG TPA: hypothetical protein VF251_03615 [Pyrinomonadaceae bacterium]